MKLRCITVLLTVGLGVGAHALGQTIPPALKNASTVSQADQSTIRQFIQSNFAKISADDPAQQSEGRDALVNAVGGEPSDAFKDAYARAVNEAALALADNPDMRVRVNAAIVVARVASRTQSLQLKPAAIKFINDKSDPVVLWGTKAHATLIPLQLRASTAGQDALLTGLVGALQDNLSAPIVLEAYEALNLNLVQARGSVTPQMIKAVVPVMQDLLSARSKQYERGIPDNPVADTIATTFLVDRDVWAQQTEQQRTRTAQLVVDLIGMAGARTVDLDSDRGRKDSLIQALRSLSSAVVVIAGNINKQSLESAAQPLRRVDSSMPGETIRQMCDELIVQAIADIPGVKRPSSLQPMASVAP